MNHEGHNAELIIVDLGQPHLTPLYNTPFNIVYAVKEMNVIHSVIYANAVTPGHQLKPFGEENFDRHYECCHANSEVNGSTN